MINTKNFLKSIDGFKKLKQELIDNNQYRSFNYSLSDLDELIAEMIVLDAIFTSRKKVTDDKFLTFILGYKSVSWYIRKLKEALIKKDFLCVAECSEWLDKVDKRIIKEVFDSEEIKDINRLKKRGQNDRF